MNGVINVLLTTFQEHIPDMKTTIPTQPRKYIFSSIFSNELLLEYI